MSRSKIVDAGQRPYRLAHPELLRLPPDPFVVASPKRDACPIPWWLWMLIVVCVTQDCGCFR